MIFQAAELGDTGRQVVLWVAMALALWQLLMFAASTFVQGEHLAMIIWASSLWLPTEVQDLATNQLCLAITWQGNNNLSHVIWCLGALHIHTIYWHPC